MIVWFMFSVCFCSKNLRKHFESVDYCLIVLLLPFDGNCSYTVSLNKYIYYFKQRLNVISQVSKSAPNFFQMPLDFCQWGQKLPPKKYVNFLPCIHYNTVKVVKPLGGSRRLEFNMWYYSEIQTFFFFFFFSKQWHVALIKSYLRCFKICEDPTSVVIPLRK